jgi:ketosteroid isomerase-like protein
MIRRLLPVFLAVGAIAACTPTDKAAVATATKPDTAALSAELAVILPAYKGAILAGDAVALNALYTDSAVVELTGIPTLVGRAAIMTTDSAQFSKGKPAEWNSTVRSTVSLGPTSAAQTGSWSDMAVVKGGMKMRRAGRWIAALQKGTDGKWRINYLMAMTDSTTTSK